MLPVATGPVNAVGAAPAHSQPPPRHGAEDHPGEERDLHDHQRPEDRRGKVAHSEIPRPAFGVIAQAGLDRDAMHLDPAGLPGGPPVLALDGGVELALQRGERALIAGDDRQRIVLGIEIARLQPLTELGHERGEVVHAAIPSCWLPPRAGWRTPGGPGPSRCDDALRHALDARSHQARGERLVFLAEFLAPGPAAALAEI